MEQSRKSDPQTKRNKENKTTQVVKEIKQLLSQRKAKS